MKTKIVLGRRPADTTSSKPAPLISVSSPTKILKRNRVRSRVKSHG